MTKRAAKIGLSGHIDYRRKAYRHVTVGSTGSVQWGCLKTSVSHINANTLVMGIGCRQRIVSTLSTPAAVPVRPA